MPTINQQGQRVDSQFFINNLNITRLSQLDRIDEATQQKLISLYENQVRASSGQANYHFALGLFYLDRRLYARAVKALENAHDCDPLSAHTLYYLALAYLAGREPGSLRLVTIRQIEECLRAVIDIDGTQAHYYYLWALIKYEYYVVNGLDDAPPTVTKLMNGARAIPLDEGEVRHMLEHVQVSGNPVLDVMLER
jgi:tetratricopeptide (TPR) repeat protein